jgi:uncharacterized protein YndB with AHSA1/START domain
VGPAGLSATVEEHDLVAGGEVTYFMTGPDGETSRGWWRVTAVDPPRSLDFTDGFAAADGRPEATLPIHRVRVRLTEQAGRMRMVLRFDFESLEDMEHLERLGAFEGIPQSVGQMDAVLATDERFERER